MYHITNALAIYGLSFDTLLKEKSAEEIIPDIEMLLKRIYEKNADIHQSCNKLKQSLRAFNSSSTEKVNGEMSKVLFNYIHRVESLLQLIRATRQGELRPYLPAL